MVVVLIGLVVVVAAVAVAAIVAAIVVASDAVLGRRFCLSRCHELPCS